LAALAGELIRAGCGYSTVLPDFDFETYSEAGYYFDEVARRWKLLPNVPKGTSHGLAAVGAAAYSEHPSTEVVSLAYDLKDGKGPQLWVPTMPSPVELFDHLAAGGLLEAWNTPFEYLIWLNVCAPRMGWPELDYRQLRDAMAKSRAFSMPGGLANAAKVSEADVQKIGDGQRLINKFSKPRNPTKKDGRLRLRTADAPLDGVKFFVYNIGDIRTEAAVSAKLPDLSPDEHELWLLDQKINFRGVHIDAESLVACIGIVKAAHTQYTAELVTITGGQVQTAGEVKKIVGWLTAAGLDMPNLQAETVEAMLDKPAGELPPNCRRVLEIRATLGAASVKKLYAIDRRLSNDGRLRLLFAYYGADRTGRFAGRGPQPQNLPSSGPEVRQCTHPRGCRHFYDAGRISCPYCNISSTQNPPAEWSIEAVKDTLQLIKGGTLADVEQVFGDAVAAISGCLRGLFVAAPGKTLICSDYSAIEAVVVAMIAGETWRIDVFRTHGKIYEKTAADLSGVPFEEILEYKRRTGNHHPLRKKLGKPGELASAYQGSVGAWRQFGIGAYIDTDDEILEKVRAWRKKSPMIVKLWYGLEAAAVSAVENPGQCFAYRGIVYGVTDDVLYCKLPSGRKLTYHKPRLIPDTTFWGKPCQKLTYEGWNSDYKKGPTGWMRLDTYGGKLTENVTQAIARDILTHAMVAIERAGYEIVLHIHDEIVAEVSHGVGSIAEFEEIMASLPAWAAGWPIKAAGGWMGQRYRKD